MSDNKAREEVITDYEQEVENGLEDVKFFSGDIASATEDEVYKEVNKMREAIARGHAMPLKFNDVK